MKNNSNNVIKINNLLFTEYDKNDLRQANFLNEIANDKEILKFLQDIAGDITSSLVNNNYHVNGYLVKDDEIDEYIGIVTIKALGYDQTAIAIERAVHQKYRNSDKKYGTRILNAITDLTFTNENISRAILEIRSYNYPAAKSALKNGFTIDYDLLEEFENEGYNYIPYTKSNPNYNHVMSPKI